MSASMPFLAEPCGAFPRFCLRTGTQTGQTLHVGAGGLVAACRAGARAGGTVAIEVGEAELNPGLPARIRRMLQTVTLPPARLELAIAETLLTRAGLELMLMLSTLRDLGIGLALAKFGSGDASLSLLRRLPLTALQLDRALIAEITHVPQDAAILRAVIQVGHAFDLAIVADGVETQAQATLLAGFGCDTGQGRLWR